MQLCEALKDNKEILSLDLSANLITSQGVWGTAGAGLRPLAPGQWQAAQAAAECGAGQACWLCRSMARRGAPKVQRGAAELCRADR